MKKNIKRIRITITLANDWRENPKAAIRKASADAYEKASKKIYSTK